MQEERERTSKRYVGIQALAELTLELNIWHIHVKLSIKYITMHIR